MPESTERGALTEAVYYILLALYHQPLHGYGLMQAIDEMTGGRVALGPGTLYGALNTLVSKGWIQGSGGAAARKKEYAITPAGQAMVAQEISRLDELLENGLRTMRREKG